jgi:hypothetical protein
VPCFAFVLCCACVQACGADDELTQEDVEEGEVDSIAQRLTQLVQEVRGGGLTCVGEAGVGLSVAYKCLLAFIPAHPGESVTHPRCFLL